MEAGNIRPDLNAVDGSVLHILLLYLCCLYIIINSFSWFIYLFGVIVKNISFTRAGVEPTADAYIVVIVILLVPLVKLSVLGLFKRVRVSLFGYVYNAYH